MDATSVVEILNNFAFPVAIVIVLLIILSKVLISYKECIMQINEKYHNDSVQNFEAINNNTNAINNMTKLIETLVSVKGTNT